MPIAATPRRCTDAPWRKYMVIALICAAQGIPFTLSGTVMGTVARANGLPLESFWLLSLVLVPFWAKLLWAPWVDRYGSKRWGRRRSWVIPCTVLAASCLFMLGAVPPLPGQFIPSFAILLMATFAMTTQDIAVDAYCIECLSPKDFGLGATVKMLFEPVGSALATWGLLSLHQRSDWQTMTTVAALLLTVLTASILIRPEAPVRDTAPVIPRPASLRSFFARPHLKPVAVILLAGGFLNQSIASVWGPYLVDRQVSLAAVGAMLGGAVLVGELAGAALANYLSVRIGNRRTLMLFAAGAPLMLVPFVMVVVSESARLWQYAVVGVIPPFVFNMLHATLTLERMKWSQGAQVATDFTGFGLFYNLGRTAAPAVAGLVVAAAGWGLYVVAVAVVLGAFALVCSATIWRYALPLATSQLTVPEPEPGFSPSR